MLRTQTPDGVPMMRLGDRLFKFANVVSIGWSYTGAAQSGFVQVPEFSQYPSCTPFAFIVRGTFTVDGGPSQLIPEATGVRWSYAIATAEQRFRANTTFVYGIY